MYEPFEFSSRNHKQTRLLIKENAKLQVIVIENENESLKQIVLELEDEVRECKHASFETNECFDMIELKETEKCMHKLLYVVGI